MDVRWSFESRMVPCCGGASSLALNKYRDSQRHRRAMSPLVLTICTQCVCEGSGAGRPTRTPRWTSTLLASGWRSYTHCSFLGEWDAISVSFSPSLHLTFSLRLTQPSKQFFLKETHSVQVFIKQVLRASQCPKDLGAPTVSREAWSCPHGVLPEILPFQNNPGPW